MARIFLALAAQLVAAAAALDSHDALLLLQAGAQRLEEANATTETLQIVKKLKAQAKHLRMSATKEVAARQAGYEKQLQKLRDEVAQLKNESLQRSRVLNKRRSANRDLFKNATHLQQECDALDVVARSLLANLSNFEESILNAMHEAERVENNSVLEVIDEQATLAKLRREERERKFLVSQVARDAGRDLALMQMDPERSQELITSFTETFEAARREEAATLQEAKRRFDESAAALAAEKKAIISERAAIDAEIWKAYQVKKTLEKSMKELKASHSYLQQRNSGLRHFLRRVAEAKESSKHSKVKKGHRLFARKDGRRAKGTKRANGTKILNIKLNHSAKA